MSRCGAGRRDAASSVAPIPRYGRSLSPCLTTSIARLATGVIVLEALSDGDSQALEVAGVVRQDLDPVSVHEHGVRVTESAEIGRVQTRLDREDHPGSD